MSDLIYYMYIVSPKCQGLVVYPCVTRPIMNTKALIGML